MADTKTTPRGRPGRPRSAPTTPILTRVSHSEHDKLYALARSQRTTISSLVGRFVRQGIERPPQG